MNNERVQQLAERAGIEWDDKYHYYVSAASLRLFAQSVAKECADLCNGIDTEYEGEDVLATWCATAIEKHFGIETVDETLRRRSTYYGNNL